MKKLLFVLFTGIILMSSCKEKESERFTLLTSTTWTPISLLADGVDASNGILANFKGDAKFNEDGTGTFGSYTGTWNFDATETKIVISTASFPVPITTNIVELTSTTLKLQALIPNQQDLTGPAINIELTFASK